MNPPGTSVHRRSIPDRAISLLPLALFGGLGVYGWIQTGTGAWPAHETSAVIIVAAFALGFVFPLVSFTDLLVVGGGYIEHRRFGLRRWRRGLDDIRFETTPEAFDHTNLAQILVFDRRSGRRISRFYRSAYTGRLDALVPFGPA